MLSIPLKEYRIHILSIPIPLKEKEQELEKSIKPNNTEYYVGLVSVYFTGSFPILPSPCTQFIQNTLLYIS